MKSFLAAVRAFFARLFSGFRRQNPAAAPAAAGQPMFAGVAASTTAAASTPVSAPASTSTPTQTSAATPASTSAPAATPASDSDATAPTPVSTATPTTTPASAETAAASAGAGTQAGSANTPFAAPAAATATAEGAPSPTAKLDAAAAGVDELAARLADPSSAFFGEKIVSVAEVKAPAAPAPPPPPPPVVEFRGVSKTYPNGFTAIKDVTFTVEDLPGRGEFVCVLGPSGCGKSTILRLIAGLTPQYPATTGEVLVAGQHVHGPGADRGMVFQDYTSFDNRTVVENIAFGLECRGVSKAEREAQAMEWVGKVGLNKDRDAHKFPHQLSGGMRQRVAIARSLILKPRIILMDEPFGALDPATRLNMQDLLMNLWREASATVFFITHSVEEAVYLGDRVYIMSPCPGTILEEMKIPAPDFPSREMQRHPEFLERVFKIRDKVETLEESVRAGT